MVKAGVWISTKTMKSARWCACSSRHHWELSAATRNRPKTTQKQVQSTPLPVYNFDSGRVELRTFQSARKYCRKSGSSCFRRNNSPVLRNGARLFQGLFLQANLEYTKMRTTVRDMPSPHMNHEIQIPRSVVRPFSHLHPV